MVYWADVMYAEPVIDGDAEESANDESLIEAKAPESADLGVEDMDAAGGGMDGEAGRQAGRPARRRYWPWRPW